tara:strand:- start:2641 stop:2883 length:243 start_codon:yes stop_codon:yes gene_type:complete
MANANEQPVNFVTATTAVTITNATAISVYANGTTVALSNGTASITIPDGVSWGVEASAGNVLRDVTITPAGASALITWMQ